MPAVDLDAVSAWAACGAMALTGRPGGPPLGPPEPLVRGLTRLKAALDKRAAERGLVLDFDVLQALGERAAFADYRRRGEVSCGGATRLVRAADGWIAVTLARADDVESVPAWLELDRHRDDPWPDIRARVLGSSCAAIVARARLLGLPVAALGESKPGPGARASDAILKTTIAPRTRFRPDDELVVVDLSSLWAGPLCSQILGEFGARVIKVESRGRPDGSRYGPPDFFDLLNGGKESVALDLRERRDLDLLRQLLVHADVVVEGSRPRALEQLGVVAADILGDGPSVWVSITGYGRTPPGREWVAFGDDAAVAGGLVVWDEAGPCFCADAIADPITGVTAAVAALAALARDEAVLLDASMTRVAATLAGPTLPVSGDVDARSPVARRISAHGPDLGEHNDTVLGELTRRQ